MATIEEQLSALINSPNKARKVKAYLDSVDPNTLAPDDQEGYYTAQRSLSRWVNPFPRDPSVAVYNTPRSPDDAISGIATRPPISQAPITDTDATLGEHLGQIPRGLADLVGIPTSREEWREAFSPKSLAINAVAGPPGRMIYDQYQSSKAALERGSKAEAIPLVGPMVVTPIKNISAPSRALASGRTPTREESLAATRSATSALVTLATAKGPARRAEMGGYNKVLNPEGAVRRAIKRAEKKVKKNVDTVRRKYPSSTAERAREGADVAEALAVDIRPTVDAMPIDPNPLFGALDRQKRARTAMRMSDAAVDTSKASIKMAKSERAFERNAPNQINRRLAALVDDLDTRLSRGDNPGAEALARYRKSGIPRNPDFVKADKVKVHEKTQARLTEPDMANIVIPEDVVINSIARETIKKAHAPIGDSPTTNPHLRDIIERAHRNGKLDAGDYTVLRDMAEGTYQIGTNKKTGAPIYGRIEMPQMLSDTVGYIERLRRENGGKLPSTPAEINAAKANRYSEIPDRAFEGELTEAEKSMNSVRRGQAMGLRRLVDEATADAGGQSQVAELNRQYANLSALETAVRNYDLSDATAPPLPPMAMAGGGGATASGLLRTLTGTGAIATVTRPFRSMLVSPHWGRNFAVASERLASMRGLKRPPAKPSAGPPVGPNFAAPPAPMGGRPSGSGPGPSRPRPTTPTGPPKPVAPVAPAAAATPVNTDLLGKQAFAYARKGELKKLKNLWNENGVDLEKSMRPSDVAWIKDKLKRYAAGAKKRAEQKSAQPTTPTGPPKPTSKPATAKPTAAPKASAPVSAPATAVASPPTRTPAPQVNLDPLGVNRIKGNWRDVKPADSVKPVVKDRDVRPVNVAAMDVDTLNAKIAEWETGRANAALIKDNKRIEWYDKKIAEARSQLSPASTKAVTSPPKGEVRNPNAGQQELMDTVRSEVDKAVEIMNGAGLKVSKTLQDISDRHKEKQQLTADVAPPPKKATVDVDDLFADTDAELAAIESASTGKRAQVQKLIDEAAKLQSAGKSKKAQELLDKALELADELEED